MIDGEGSTGWSTSGAEGQANQLVVNFSEPLRSSDQPGPDGKFKGPDELQVELLFERHFAAALGRFRLSLSSGPPAVASGNPVAWQPWLVGMTAETIDEQQYRMLQKQFVLTGEAMADERKEIEKLKDAMPEEIRSLGMQQREPQDSRPTHRHHRGEYLQPREEVAPGVPAIFRDAADSPVTNRLEMSRWLVSDENPLVGRVTVNRAWREFFGAGIVKTAGDFGTQSQPPSHPELLDHLAVDFVSGGWSLKRLHRKIVSSSTYQQSIGAPPTSDPENRFLSVFPQRRLQGEQIRDAFLSAAGLLSLRVGGPSVYPPQPASVMQMAYGSPNWETSEGADRYRRSIYTFSKRTRAVRFLCHLRWADGRSLSGAPRSQ